MHIAAREPDTLEALLQERGLAATLDRYDPARFADLLAVLAGRDAVDHFEPVADATSELASFLAHRRAMHAGPGRYLELPLRPPSGQGWSGLLAEVAREGAVAPEELGFRELVRVANAPHNYGPFLLLLPFANACFVHGDDDDEAIVVAAKTATAAGHHWTFRYSSRGVDLSDAAWASLAAGLIGVLGPGRGTVFGVDDAGSGESCSLPAHLDPARLAARASWLASALFGISMGNIKRDLAGAAPFADFEDELPQLAAHPHLALHWLLYHFLLGHQAPLREALAATAEVSDRWVQEVRTIVQGDASVLPLGAVDARLLEKLRANVPKKQKPGPRPKRKVEPAIEVPPPPPPVKSVPEKVEEIYPAFVQWLTSLGGSQREKAARVREEWLPALQSLPDDQRQLVSRLVRAQLNFPEVRDAAAEITRALS